MPPNPTEAATHCATEVEQLFRSIASQLKTFADSLLPNLTAPPMLAQHLIDAAHAPALALLSEQTVVGAGFAAARDTAANRPHLLAWWQGDDRAPIPSSTVLSDTTDYTHQEWFRVPSRTGAFHITGPYIDYVCTDEFVITCTLPVYRAEQFLGVAGLDILAETLESVLLPVFRTAKATLVNHHSRVMLSGDPTLFAGDAVDTSRFSTVLTCSGLPATVLA